MKKVGFRLFIFLVFCSVNSFCQDTVYFKKGLMVNAPAQYGREAISTDILAYQLYTNTLQQPLAGKSFGKDEDGEELTWQALVADSLNRLRPETRPERGSGRRFRGSYVYLTYNSGKKQNALFDVKK